MGSEDVISQQFVSAAARAVEAVRQLKNLVFRAEIETERKHVLPVAGK